MDPVDSDTGNTTIRLTFNNVIAGGVTTVTSTTLGEGQAAPRGFKLGNPEVVYEVSTTATFSGQIEVCLDYSDTSYGNKDKLKLPGT